MQRLWVRITLSFLLLIFFVLLATGIFLAGTMKNTYLDLKETQLKETANLLAKAIEPFKLKQNQQKLQQEVNDLATAVKPRITVIDHYGDVLADTEDDPLLMENHADRPEVQQVMTEGKRSGLMIRYSKTLGYSMMYVAVPILDNDQVNGVVRASLSLENIEQSIRNIRITLSAVLLAALMLTMLVGIRIAKGIAKPIEEIVSVSEKLKEKDYSARVKEMNPKGELGQLTEAINVLGASLEQQMDKIRENEQQLTGVLTNMMSGVLLVNKEGSIMLANRAMGDMLGLDPHSFTGKHHLEVGKSTRLSQLLDQCLKDCTELRDEVHFYFPKEKIIDVHLAPYWGKDRELIGIVAVLHDITHIRRLEQIRSEFVANVSHELKTPITSVKGFAETLLDGAMENKELLNQFLNIIYKESDRLHRLISDLLHLSKIEQHAVPLRIEKINLQAAASAAANTIQKEAEEKGVEIILPDQEDLWIEGEKDRIQQIILNLISNSIDYTPEGGKISISMKDQGDHVQLCVKDTGIGIGKDDLPRIFERFYRVDKARARDSGGTGLGLAIVKHLVESHHGSIQVDSQEGQGTVFTIKLPKEQKS